MHRSSHHLAHGPFRRPSLRSASGLVALLACVTSCAGPTRAAQGQALDPKAASPLATPTGSEEETSPSTPDAPLPWTDAFLARAVVVADHVRIEGPVGLLEHVVVSSDDALYERQAQHVGPSFVQTTVRLSNEVPEIRVQLDQWQFAALQRVTIVEHLGPRDVTIVATGDAAYRDPLGGDRHAETLEWTGTIQR